MLRPLLIFSCCLGLSMFSAFAPAQDTDDAAAAEPAGEFDSLLAEWKEILTRMREIQLEYKVAEPDEQTALSDEFDALRAKGRELTPQLMAAAETAYTAAPSEEGDATQFVVSMLVDNIQRDGYEEAYRLAKLLIDNGYGDKAVHGLAGIAAFNLNEVDEAEAHFNTADEAGKLDPRAKELRLKLDSHREKWEKEQALRAQEDAAEGEEALPRVKLETTKGDILLELFENEAPNTVANFVNLVEKGFYDGVVFHRVLEGFMAQGGDPDGTGSGGPGYTIPCECYQENHRQHFRGSLSMAKGSARDSGGSQFFLTFVPTDHLDGAHTVFGRIIEGFDVLSKLQRRDPESPNPPEPDKIVKATVVRKRNHEYVPETIPE